MNTRVMAQDYIRRAGRFLREAEDAYSDGDYATCVRRSSESVEMSSKGALRLMGIEYPKRHDVSDLILSLKDRADLPRWFSEAIPYISENSRELTLKRGPAMYGYESELKPASEIFNVQDAKDALTAATKILDICKKLLATFY